MPRNAPPPPLDTRQWVENPEGIDLALRPAGLVVRGLAYGVDLVIRIAMFVAVVLGFDALGIANLGLIALLLFVLDWWYMVAFEVFNQGRTPGKHLMKLSVVMANGTAVGGSASLIRNLLRFVDLLPFGYGVGIVCCLYQPQFRRLGDLAADTLVVHTDAAVGATTPSLAAAPLTAPFPLTLDDQRAILAFAARQGELTRARADELADLLREPLQVASAAAARAHLDGLAQGLIHNRPAVS